MLCEYWGPIMTSVPASEKCQHNCHIVVSTFSCPVEEDPIEIGRVTWHGEDGYPCNPLNNSKSHPVLRLTTFSFKVIFTPKRIHWPLASGNGSDERAHVYAFHSGAAIEGAGALEPGRYTLPALKTSMNTFCLLNRLQK